MNSPNITIHNISLPVLPLNFIVRTVVVRWTSCPSLPSCDSVVLEVTFAPEGVAIKGPRASFSMGLTGISPRDNRNTTIIFT